MDTQNRPIAPNKKALLSTIWIFTVLNYLYCGVVSLIDTELFQQYLTGRAGDIEMT